MVDLLIKGKEQEEARRVTKAKPKSISDLFPGLQLTKLITLCHTNDIASLPLVYMALINMTKAT